MSIRVVVYSQYNRLPQLRTQLNHNAGAIVHEAADRLVEIAYDLAPKRTGYMASTIDARTTGAMNVVVVVGAYYAAYVEYGTVKMQAQPFIGPAVEEVRPWFLDAMQNELF